MISLSMFSAICKSCTLWDLYCSKERSSYQCWSENELWKLRKKHLWSENCNLSISSTAGEQLMAKIWTSRILVLMSAPCGMLVSQGRYLFWASQVYIWVPFFCFIFYRTSSVWWLAVDNLKLSIDTLSALLDWNPGLSVAKSPIISKTGSFCILNHSIH